MFAGIIDKISGAIDTASDAPRVYQKGLMFEEYFWPVTIVVIIIILILVTIIIRQRRGKNGFGHHDSGRMRVCPRCGMQNPANNRCCQDCGNQFVIPGSVGICPHCNAENLADDVICDSCEKDMRVSPRGASLAPPTPKAKPQTQSSPAPVSKPGNTAPKPRPKMKLKNHRRHRTF